MLPLGGPLIALAMFQQSLPITDTAFTTTASGRDIQAITGTRDIFAAVDPSNSKRLEQIFGGSMADGDIGIFTTAVLYVVDEGNAASKPQSFATYSGTIYRIVDQADWTTQAGVYVYLARRHTALEILTP